MTIQKHFDALIVPALKSIEAEYPHLTLTPSMEYTETKQRAILDIKINNAQMPDDRSTTSMIIPSDSSKAGYEHHIEYNLRSMGHLPRKR